MVEVKTKKTLIYRLSEKDTGSVPYQISQLEAKVRQAAEHLKTNKKDIPFYRALVKRNAQKKILLKYLERRRPKQYQDWLEWKKRNSV